MTKEEKIRVNVTLTGDLAKAFKRELGKTLATNATLTRVAIEKYLNDKGYDVSVTSRWGGSRKSESDEVEGQYAAVSVR